MPRISIIIPNRNYEKYLPDCLNSVAAQTLKDWECIIVDDASTDTSCEVIQRFCDSDPRFKLIKHPACLGISAARNSGLDIASGDYIAFLDSDDCFTEIGLEGLLNIALALDADMVGAQTTIVPDNFKFIARDNAASIPMTFTWQSKANIYLSWGKTFNWCWIWRRIYKRDLIGDVRFITDFITLGDDLGFMLDISYKAKRIVETPLISTYHRIHESSITQQKFSPQTFLFFAPLFKHVTMNLLDKYDNGFWQFYFNDTFKYMLMEMIFKPSQFRMYQKEARDALRETVKLIPKKYLTRKNRIFAQVLKW
ncbi:MAG: glycosyltransferase [Rickettsiales bacterium]|jgi:glycosyltransferase involved in cell wall biosynthesis|nr:glycosyltransferase [Rickettsiales bacterium]